LASLKKERQCQLQQLSELQDRRLTAGRADVIDHDEQGYFLRDWIVVRDGDNSECPCDVPADDPANVPAGSSDVPAGTDLNPRQLWILNQLRQGVAIQRVTVEKEFDIGEKTAKRDLSELVQREMIEYLRKGREGSYRLT